MPHAVTHFLIPALLVALFRDFYLRKRDKRNFPLHYVLIAGLAGLLMDFDYILYYAIEPLGFSFPSHRIFFHNISFIFGFLILGIAFMKTKIGTLGKHRLKLSTIFFIISFGAFIHLILDFSLMGAIMPFYPFSDFNIGLNILKQLPEQFHSTIMPVIDAALLVFWMIYLQIKHRISDYI